jgi:hypothetical protein
LGKAKTNRTAKLIGLKPIEGFIFCPGPKGPGNLDVYFDRARGPEIELRGYKPRRAATTFDVL